MKPKNKQRRSIATLGIPMAVFTALIITTSFMQKTEKFRRNPTDHCDLKIRKSEHRRGFMVNGDTSELFVMSQQRGYHYLFSKKYPGGGYDSNTSDTAVYRLAKYELKEFQGQLFLHDELIGTVDKGDYIIVRGDPLIEVYDKDRVTTEDPRIRFNELQRKMTN